MSDVIAYDGSKSAAQIASDESLSKSERARILVLKMGLSQYRAAKLIGIRPQFVSNVIGNERDKQMRASNKG